MLYYMYGFTLLGKDVVPSFRVLLSGSGSKFKVYCSNWTALTTFKQIHTMMVMNQTHFKCSAQLLPATWKNICECIIEITWT